MDEQNQSRALEIMRETTLGKCLISTLQEIEEDGTFNHISEENKNSLFHGVMTSFDRKFQETLNTQAQINSQSLKISVKSQHKESNPKQSSIVWYNNSNDEWKLQLKDVEFKGDNDNICNMHVFN